MKLSLENAKQDLGELFLGAGSSCGDINFDLLCRDTRQLQAGQIYIALPGARFDGHDFIEVALQRDASMVICEHYGNQPLDEDKKERCFLVTDTLAALQAWAHAYRKRFGAQVIAITGSVGKTTAKEMISQMLSAFAPTHSSPSSYNNELGVPLTLLGVSDHHKYVVLECGARHLGDIGFLCSIAEPDIGICLNARSAHLEIFGSYQNLLQTKSQMFQGTRSRGSIVCLRDQEDLYQNALSSARSLYTFGGHPEATISIVSSKVLSECRQAVTLRKGEDSFEIVLPCYHVAYSYNLAAALACATALGLEISGVAKALEGFVPPSGRFEIFTAGPWQVVDDSYNANPESMQAGLLSFRNTCKNPQSNSYALILGDMLELGPESLRLHQEIGAFVAENLRPQLLVLVGKRASDYLKGIQLISPQNESSKVMTFVDVDQLLEDWTSIQNTLEGLKIESLFLKASNAIGLKKVSLLLRQLFSDGS